jgi:hypothetical protein
MPDRKIWEADRDRYRAERQRLIDSGLPENHPLIERQTRRIEIANRVLGDRGGDNE